jgi:hypothetical protein
MTPCSVVVGYTSLRGRQHEYLKHWYPTSTLHAITTQKTSTGNIITVKASKLASFVSLLKIYEDKCV